MNYTDIHTHILYGVDDGSPDKETSIAMLRKTYDEGVRNLIVTPHFGIRNADYDKETALESFRTLKEYSAQEIPDLKLYMGNEVYFDYGAMRGLEEGVACTLAGSSYVLVEFPFVTDFEEMFHGVRRFVLEGYIPVIAHVERYEKCIGKLSNLEDLISQGALVQMNCDTIVSCWEGGFFGRRFWPVKALKAGLVQFIASDCHDMDTRPPEMKKAAEYLIEIVGKDKAEEILYENPGRILYK